MFGCLNSMGLLDPLWSLLHYLWAHGGAIWAETISILVAGLVVWIIYSILQNFANKARASLAKVPERVVGKPCQSCNGEGTLPCAVCKGTGAVSRHVERESVCKRCSGTKQSEVSCATCGGRRSLTRSVRFNATGISAGTRWSLIPLGWWEDVRISVQNTDVYDATFSIVVSLADPSRTTKSESAFIAAGSQSTVTVTFRVPDRNSLPAQFGVGAPAVSEPCPTCNGRGAVTAVCPDCSGRGVISEPTSVEEACEQCGRSKRETCKDCGGRGRVYPALF